MEGWLYRMGSKEKGGCIWQMDAGVAAARGLLLVVAPRERIESGAPPVGGSYPVPRLKIVILIVS